MKAASLGEAQKDRLKGEDRRPASADPCSWPAPGGNRQSLFIVMALFAGASVYLIVKSLAIEYPCELGDEYYYSIFSHYFGRGPELFAHDKYLVLLPNELYLRIYSAAHLMGNNFYRFAKISNSLLFAAAVFPIYAASRSFLPRRPALLLSALIMLAPVDSYTAYFTPESCYFLGFWVFTYLFISNLPDRALMAGLTGGIALGLLVLIKPHALTILIAANLTILAVMLLPRSIDLCRKDALSCLTLLDAAFVITVAILHVGFFGHRDADIFGFYRSFATVGIPDRFLYARQVVRVALGHLAYVAPIYGLPVIVTILGAAGLLSSDGGQTRGRLRIFCIFSILVLGLLLAMTASSVAVFAFVARSPIELTRIASRYYNFALPLVLISFYALLDQTPPDSCRKPLLWGTLVCLTFVLLGWMYFSPRLTVNVIDDPEMAWLTQPFPIAGPIFWVATCIMLGYYLVRGFGNMAVYSRYLAVSLITGSVLVFFAVYQIYSETPADRGGVLIRYLFEGAESDHGLVVGSDLGLIFRSLFGINANPSVLLLARGAAIGPAQIGGAQRWILALDNYDLRVPSTTLLATAGLKIVRLEAPVRRSQGESGAHLKMAQMQTGVGGESAQPGNRADDLVDAVAGCGKRDFRSLLPLSYLSREERRVRKEASFYAGCRKLISLQVPED